jgi:CBS domain-containing protein
MVTVRQILQKKGSSVWSIHPDASLTEALQLMAWKDVGALLVTEDEKIVGIFSERDYARNFALLDKSTKDIRVRDLMSTPVLTVRPGQSIGACMTMMTERHVRHLPVVEREKVVGIISIGDVVKAIIEEQQYVISQLSQPGADRKNTLEDLDW